MTSTALSQIEKLDAKLAQLIEQKKKIKDALDGVLLSSLKENGAFDIEFSVLIGAMNAMVLKLKTNVFSESDLSEFKLLGEKYTKKSSRRRSSKPTKKPSEKTKNEQVEKQAA